MPDRTPGTALILGATGRFGRQAHAAFCAAGWRVRLFDRSRDDLWDAAWGADVIVNGWNPPYTRWAEDLPGQTQQIIEVAEASGATVIQPANVYVYGMEAPERHAPETPHHAHTSLGRLRAEMETAYRASKARVVLLRAGDFLDTEASGNWFDRVMTIGLSRGRVTYPGPLDRPHAWAFLPDVARAAVALAERRASLPRFADLSFEGYSLTGAAMVEAIEVASKRHLRLMRFPWLILRLSRRVWPFAAALLEMRYLWTKSHSLDGRALEQLCPEIVTTPLEEALRLAIAPQLEIDPYQSMRRCFCHGCRADFA